MKKLLLLVCILSISLLSGCLRKVNNTDVLDYEWYIHNCIKNGIEYGRSTSANCFEIGCIILEDDIYIKFNDDNTFEFKAIDKNIYHGTFKDVRRDIYLYINDEEIIGECCKPALMASWNELTFTFNGIEYCFVDEYRPCMTKDEYYEVLKEKAAIVEEHYTNNDHRFHNGYIEDNYLKCKDCKFDLLLDDDVEVHIFDLFSEPFEPIGYTYNENFLFHVYGYKYNEVRKYMVNVYNLEN